MTLTPDWHASMYDEESANKTINSADSFALAMKEVEGLLDLLSLGDHARVLDVPCGTGRHAKAFAASGLEVTGIDINPMLVQMAQRNCAGLPASFVCGSMADLVAYRGKFDLVTNLFSSFGYFDTDEENATVMEELVSALAPGGRIVVHVIDRDWLMKIYQPVSWSESDKAFHLAARKYDPVSKYNEVNEVKIDKDTNVAQRTYHRMRLYDSDEMKAMLEASGLQDIKIFGGFDGRSFERGQTSHPVYVASMPKAIGRV